MDAQQDINEVLPGVLAGYVALREEQALELDDLRREWQTSESLLAGSQRWVQSACV